MHSCIQKINYLRFAFNQPVLNLYTNLIASISFSVCFSHWLKYFRTRCHGVVRILLLDAMFMQQALTTSAFAGFSDELIAYFTLFFEPLALLRLSEVNSGALEPISTTRFAFV